ncbi:MAG: barstar family protein, partial [Microlunatus sp.]|nr:barstar family protein [Microlunatus sp.]
MTTDLQPLFSDPVAGGVYRVPADLGDLPGRLESAGWSVARLGPFRDPAGFYTEIAARLGFPDYFGRNLDALWDCLRAIRQPTAVIIDWTGFADDHPDPADRLLAVLA